MSTSTATPQQSDAKRSPDATAHLIAGAIAGLVSAVTLQPFDLLKTRLQQQQVTSKHEVRTSVVKELRKLTEMRDLWRGTLPSTLRTSIGAGLYFTILSKMRTDWAEHKRKKDLSLNLKSGSSVLPKLTPMENLTTGFIARAIVGYITMPITIIKTRYESNLYHYNSMYEGILGIYMGDNKGAATATATATTTPLAGSIKNFFKGSVATLARDCPYAGLYVLTYELFKNDLMPVLIPPGLGDNRSSVINSAAAVMAASTCTTLTAPFDAIKTRLQLTNETSMVKAMKTLIHEDGGVRNLFRGLLLRLGRKGISAGISWCIYEELLKSQFVQSKFIKKKEAPLD
ncbi:Solute carrier family 25 member 38 [Candida viswanathii]|uniref:Mitochondrial glycine transporter n=1 Tax=Candida viswanathii TaxID=5486 RepID=A0A367Y8M7_9ASCO|nr:Solute carrier family 25 member 38 [Candida viswanathii]